MAFNRRQFIEYTALICADMVLLPRFAGAADIKKSRVANGYYSRGTGSAGKIDPENVSKLFEETLKTFCQTSNIHDAWLKIFPDLNEKDKIGIKVNVINRFMPTHPQVVKCVTDSLTGFGVDSGKIIIWDRSDNELKKAGYTLNPDSKGVKCYGSGNSIAGFDENHKVAIGDKKIPVSNILSKEIKYLINMPVLKDHGNAGMTFSMKNHYGSIPLIDRLPNPKAILNAHHVHANNCETQIPELNSDKLIREKTRLIIGDAILGIYEGGPSGTPQFAPNRILISQDPVAADFTAMELVDKKRIEMGLSGVRKRAKYIEYAAKIGLGQCDKNNIELLEIKLD